MYIGSYLDTLTYLHIRKYCCLVILAFHLIYRLDNMESLIKNLIKKSNDRTKIKISKIKLKAQCRTYWI